MSENTLFGVRLRREQAAILAYNGGRMAISAVPGSGKTLTLALLAAKLILDGRIGPDGEVLVVTMQNSAVDNIAARIRQILQRQGLPPVGYRVCTLHKLASEILRQRCDLVGLEEYFSIVDDTESERLMTSAAATWIEGHRACWASFLPEDSEVRRKNAEEKWREETREVGRGVTRLCKHRRLTPQQAQKLAATDPEGFLRMGIDLYALYTAYLQARSGLDFDDLIWRAIEALEQDESFLLNLRARWPYILEDEAQDSSPLQERILERLSGKGGNWVRVGDPNQAINSTFTSADPRYFRRFWEREDVRHLSLSESGRCARPIIALANHLVDWVVDSHPEMAVREMAFKRQHIQPTSPGDGQPNPPDEECHIRFGNRPFPDPKVQAGQVVRWASDYVRRHPDRTAAILCPTHWIGADVMEAAQALHPPGPFDDLLRSTPKTRNVARVLASVCEYLADPTQGSRLAKLYATLVEDKYLKAHGASPMRQQTALLRSVPPHKLLFPHGAPSVRELLPTGVELSDQDAATLARFAELVARWVRALGLSIDQLILTIAQDLFTDVADLAICHTIATSFRTTSEMHPEWRLAEFASELKEVAHNRRGFGGATLADSGYNPEKGRIAVTTMHKAKGLEWDAVYLICVDDLEFPSTLADAFRDEPYFMPGRSPALEARKRLEQLAGADFATPPDQSPVEQARLEYIAERLRLLYVGITRAKRDLAFTWCETRSNRRVRQATALAELRAFHSAYGSGGAS